MCTYLTRVCRCRQETDSDIQFHMTTRFAVSCLQNYKFQQGCEVSSLSVMIPHFMTLHYVALVFSQLKCLHGSHDCIILKILLLLPLALQPTVGFGLANNILPFFSICHQLSPSSHS
jgi:hypothetical protein